MRLRMTKTVRRRRCKNYFQPTGRNDDTAKRVRAAWMASGWHYLWVALRRWKVRDVREVGWFSAWKWKMFILIFILFLLYIESLNVPNIGFTFAVMCLCSSLRVLKYTSSMSCSVRVLLDALITHSLPVWWAHPWNKTLLSDCDTVQADCRFAASTHYRLSWVNSTSTWWHCIA